MHQYGEPLYMYVGDANHREICCENKLTLPSGIGSPVKRFIVRATEAFKDLLHYNKNIYFCIKYNVMPKYITITQDQFCSTLTIINRGFT